MFSNGHTLIKRRFIGTWQEQWEHRSAWRCCRDVFNLQAMLTMALWWSLFKYGMCHSKYEVDSSPARGNEVASRNEANENHSQVPCNGDLQTKQRSACPKYGFRQAQEHINKMSSCALVAPLAMLKTSGRFARFHARSWSTKSSGNCGHDRSRCQPAIGRFWQSGNPSPATFFFSTPVATQVLPAAGVRLLP